MRNAMKKVLLILATTIMNCTNDNPDMTLDDLIDAADGYYEDEGTEEKFSERLFELCNELLAPDGIEKLISEWEDVMQDDESGEEALKNLYAQYGVEM